MIHFECGLNRRFWRKKKWYKLSKLGVQVIWAKSKRTATFFVKPSLSATNSVLDQNTCFFGGIFIHGKNSPYFI